MATLTIGTAVYDDFDGLFFTLQSILSSLPDAAVDSLQFVIVDNHPKSKHGLATAKYAARIGAKYVPFTAYAATTVKGSVFTHAVTDYVLCLDSHVLLTAGSLDRLMAYLNTGPTKELIHGVLLNELNCVIATHMEPVWRGKMLGTWATASRDLSDDAPVFEIPQHGMGLFCCHREFWPGFNPLFRGFGGEEGYIHEKVRQRGGKVVCLPGLKWIHRFSRPDGAPHVVSNVDKCMNYLIGFAELGLPLEPILEHFGEDISCRAQKILHAKKITLTGVKNCGWCNC